MRRSSVRGDVPAPSTDIPKVCDAFHRKVDPDKVYPPIRPDTIRWDVNAIEIESPTNNVG